MFFSIFILFNFLDDLMISMKYLMIDSFNLIKKLLIICFIVIIFLYFCKDLLSLMLNYLL